MLKLTGRLLAGAALFALPATIHAQAAPKAAAPIANQDEDTSDIIVTATKTGATKLQSTPLAISAFGADQIAQTASSNIKDLAQYIPNLNISQVTTNPVLTLRGVGTNNVFNGSDPDVTVQVDGVYIARPSAQANDFLDIERVEVLRGPQGTLYGRNAIGGTVNVISRAPTERWTGEGVVTFGNFGLVQPQAYVSGAIVPDRVRISLSGTYTRHNDYEQNINTASTQSGVFNANRGGLKGQILLIATDRIDATTRADFVQSDEDLPGPYHLQVATPQAPLANTIFGDYTKVAINTPSTSSYRAGGVSEEINIGFGSNLNLKSITAVRYNRYRLQTDNDGTELNNIVGNFYEREHQHSQEFDLSGKFGPLSAVVGAYYLDERAFTDVSATIIFPARIKINSLVKFRTESFAGFAQGTLKITPTLSATAGVRYTDETKSIDVFVTRTSLVSGATLPGFPVVFQLQDGGTNPPRHFTAWTPKFGLDYQVTPAILLYASATKGYKSGGTNYATNSVATASFDPETIWSYEAGFKADFFDRRLRFNLSAFHYDYSNLQIQSSISPGVVSIGNAAQARVDGIEAEFGLKVTPAFRLDGNISALRAKYSKFTTASVAAALAPLIAADPRYNAAAGIYDASGHKLNQSPDYSGTVAATYDFRLPHGDSISLRGDVYFQGRTFYDPQNSVYTDQAPYALLNGQLGYASADKSFQVRVFAKNLLDKQYLFAFQANGVAPAGFAAAPRTFGVRISKSYR